MQLMVAAFVLSVFHGSDALGNPTGVIILDHKPEEGRAQLIAARLGLPDTVFTWASGSDQHASFFSPSERLAVCYQALIGAAQTLGRPSVEFVLRDRTLLVESFDGLRWVRTPSALVAEEGTVDTPFGQGRIVDTGRRRAYVAVDGERFESIRWAPEAAEGWLRASSLSGVCLVQEQSSDTVRLRVFTTSLGGREDVATGGAVAGLSTFLGRDGSWVVRQGLGPAFRRGELLLRSGGGAIHVGGRAELLISGTLDARLLATDRLE